MRVRPFRHPSSRDEMGGCSPASRQQVLLLAALVAWVEVTSPPSLSSCDAKGVVSLHEVEAIYYRGGEAVGIVRETVSRMTQIAHGDEAEKRSERDCAFVYVRVTCDHHSCVAAMENVYSFVLYLRHGAQDSASDCNFRI